MASKNGWETVIEEVIQKTGADREECIRALRFPRRNSNHSAVSEAKRRGVLRSDLRPANNGAHRALQNLR